MTDLKPEDLARLREIAEKATPGPWETGGSSVTNWHDDTFEMEWIPNGQDDEAEADGVNANAAADAEFIAAFNPQVALSLLADRARMEKALDHALAALVNVTVNWGSTPDDDDAEGWCRQADTKRSVAQTALAQLGWGIDWNAIGRGEKDTAKLLKALGASQ